MALPKSLEDRIYKGWVEISGLPHRLVSGVFTGSTSTSGLSNAGRITEVAINNLTWTPLPAVAQVGRNAMALQNRAGEDIKVGYDPLEPGYVGMIVPDNGERAYDITDAITLYAKSSASAVTITVEEIS